MIIGIMLCAQTTKMKIIIGFVNDEINCTSFCITPAISRKKNLERYVYTTEMIKI